MDFGDIRSFDGKTAEAQDTVRLTGQLKRVFDVLSDGRWHSLWRLVSEAGPGTHASIQARCRDLRKPKFGGYTVKCKRVSGGVWAYRMDFQGELF